MTKHTSIVDGSAAVRQDIMRGARHAGAERFELREFDDSAAAESTSGPIDLILADVPSSSIGGRGSAKPSFVPENIHDVIVPLLK